METIRDKILAADEEAVIAAICYRYRNNRYLHKTVLKCKTREMVEKLKSIPKGESEYILICFMGYTCVGPAEWEFSPSFGVIRKDDMANFCTIQEFEEISLWPGLGDTYFDDLNFVKVYRLGEIETVPAPIVWNVEDVNQYLNADFYPQLAFNDDELVIEFVDHYIQTLLPVDSGSPQNKTTDFFRLLETKAENVKNRIARYQHLKFVYQQLRGK